MTGMTSRNRERCREVIEMVEAHVPYVDIAAQLGVTRNVIAGIVYRMRREAGKTTTRKSAPPASAPREIPWSPIVESRSSLPLADRPVVVSVDECRWPIGDVGAPGFHFCCGPALKGGPYCAEHHKLAHVGRGDWSRSNYSAIRFGGMGGAR